MLHRRVLSVKQSLQLLFSLHTAEETIVEMSASDSCFFQFLTPKEGEEMGEGGGGNTFQML